MRVCFSQTNTPENKILNRNWHENLKYHGNNHEKEFDAPDLAQRLTPESIDVLISYRKRFLSYLTRWLGDEALAEDILQASYARALERGGLRSEERVVSWFQRLLRNLAIDHLRKQSAEERATLKWASNEAEFTSLPDELASSLCGCIHDMIASLPNSQEQVLRSVDLEELSIAETAEKIGISQNNTRVRLHRARMSLRNMLLATCGICAEHGCLDCWCHTSPSDSPRK